MSPATKQIAEKQAAKLQEIKVAPKTDTRLMF